MSCSTRCRLPLAGSSTSVPATGRWVALVRAERPESAAVAVDVSEPMLERARERFADQPVELHFPRINSEN